MSVTKLNSEAISKRRVKIDKNNHKAQQLYNKTISLWVLMEDKLIRQLTHLLCKSQRRQINNKDRLEIKLKIEVLILLSENREILTLVSLMPILQNIKENQLS